VAADEHPFALETERLRLVQLDGHWVEDLAAIYADPEVARYIGAGGLTPEGTREQVATFERVWRELGYGQSALVERDTGRMIGRAGLHPWPVWGELELGYALARDRWGLGLAREACEVWLDWAFRHLPEDHLIAVIQPANAASIALAERLGFGFDRDDVTPSGVEVAIYRIDRAS
jgi:RimJ/RimL family protein N-acetyltransferase